MTIDLKQLEDALPRYTKEADAHGFYGIFDCSDDKMIIHYLAEEQADDLLFRLNWLDAECPRCSKEFKVRPPHLPITAPVDIEQLKRDLDKRFNRAENENYSRYFMEDIIDHLAAQGYLNGQAVPMSVLKQVSDALKKLKNWGDNGMEPDYKKWVNFHMEVSRVSGEALEYLAPFLKGNEND